MAVSLKNLRHLRLLAKTGNFTRAANLANVSQSALSRSIEKLEGHFEVRLFNRDTKKVTPTVFGQALLEEASVIDQRVDSIHRKVAAIKNVVTGHLRVALGVYPAEIAGYGALGTMSQRYPGLTIRAEVCNWQEVNTRVLNDQVDLAYAVVSQAQHETRLEVETVTGHEMAYYVRAGHPLAERSSIEREELDAFPLISIRVPAELAPLIHGKSAIDESTGFLIPAIEIDDFTVARGVVRSSDAIGVSTALQIARELESGEFRLLHYPRPWIAPTFGFIQKRGYSLSPSAQAFKECVRRAEEIAGERNRDLLNRYLPL
jgi:DNA-binding transcriptional LysR family regulator